MSLGTFVANIRTSPSYAFKWVFMISIVITVIVALILSLVLDIPGINKGEAVGIGLGVAVGTSLLLAGMSAFSAFMFNVRVDSYQSLGESKEQAVHEALADNRTTRIISALA